MSKDDLNIDVAGRPARYYRRCFENALAILFSDAVVMALSLCAANGLLLLINDIPFSIQNGFLIIPAWSVVTILWRLLPGWGVGTVDELRRVQGALCVLFALILAVSYFTRTPLSSSRIVFLFTYLFSAVALPVSRSITRSIVISMGRWGVPVALYGDLHSVKEVIEAISAEKSLGYIPSAIFTDDVAQGTVVHGVSVLGGLKNTTSRVPVAIIAMPDAPRHQLIETLDGPSEVYRRVIVIPDLDDAPSLWVVPRDLQGILGLEITKNLLNPMARFFKRLFDLMATFLSAPLWFPLVVLIYILIWLEDRKNPLFLQPRIGRTGGTFRTAKFRTMVPDAEQVLQDALKKDPELRAEWEAHFKLKKDPRITKVGRFLRKTSLDEIPQLLNVIRGTMSIVGPRPLPAYHHQELPERVRFLRDKVQPGITGLWQVSGRSDAGTAGMEKWDPYYVRNWSIWLDMTIILRTVRVVLCGSGAY